MPHLLLSGRNELQTLEERPFHPPARPGGHSPDVGSAALSPSAECGYAGGGGRPSTPRSGQPNSNRRVWAHRSCGTVEQGQQVHHLIHEAQQPLRLGEVLPFQLMEEPSPQIPHGFVQAVETRRHPRSQLSGQPGTRRPLLYQEQIGLGVLLLRDPDGGVDGHGVPFSWSKRGLTSIPSMLRSVEADQIRPTSPNVSVGVLPPRRYARRPFGHTNGSGEDRARACRCSLVVTFHR